MSPAPFGSIWPGCEETAVLFCFLQPKLYDGETSLSDGPLFPVGIGFSLTVHAWGVPQPWASTVAGSSVRHSSLKGITWQ